MSYHSRTLVLASQAPAIGEVISVRNERMFVESLGKVFRISDDMPSTHGSHLLGYEGYPARYAYLRPVQVPVVPAKAIPVAKVGKGFSNVVPAPSATLLRPMQLVLRAYLDVSDPKAKRRGEPDPTLIELAAYGRYKDRSGRMSLAWIAAKRAANLLGGAPRHYLGAALRAIAACNRNAGRPVNEVIEAVRAAWHRA